MTLKHGNFLIYRRDYTRKTASEAVVPAKGKMQIGICDLDTSAGALPALLSHMEGLQNQFMFFPIDAPWQTGLTFPGQHVAVEWNEHTGTEMACDDAEANVSAKRIFAAARPVLKGLPVERLILIVKSMISDVSGDPTHNLFSTVSGRIALVSTYGLREYAAKAGRPFEVAVFQVMLSALLAMVVRRVEYVKKTTGSIFDYCENRADIVRAIRNPTIDALNRSVIPARLLQPTEKMLDALKSYEGLVSKTKRRRLTKSVPSTPKNEDRDFGDILRSLARFTQT